MFGIDVLAALLLLAVIANHKRIGALFSLSKIRLRSALYAPASRSEAPPHVVHLLSSAEAGLKPLGFDFVGTLAAPPINALDPRSRAYYELFWHSQFPVLACTELAAFQTGQITKVLFLTAFTDGTLLLTVNRESFQQLPVPPEATVLDAYADDLATQWQAHREALASPGEHRTPVTERREVIRRHAEFGQSRWIQRMEEMGWVREDADGLFRFTPRGIWLYSRQLTHPPAGARRALARPYRHQPVPDVRAARLAEMDSVAANIALAAHPYPAWMKATLFTVTLAVSAVLFGGGFGLMEATALLTVLLVHELGHLVAMWVFNYSNLSIFFLPFLGAAASGHKPHAPPWQEAIVLLAGPVTGLALAIAAIQIPSASLPAPALEFFRAFAKLGLLLNLFNLLPFGMLDGGRLFELAVLGRFPYARAAFATLGAILGLLYAFWAHSLVFGVLMFLLLSATRLQFRAARVVAAIRAKAKAAGVKFLRGEQAIAALGREFARGDYGGEGAKGWMQRFNIAKLAYPRLLQGIPGFGVTVGVLAAQGNALIGPLVLAAWYLRQPAELPLLQTTVAEKQAMAKQDAKDPENLRALAAQKTFLALYEAEADPQRKWAMLEKHEEEFEGGNGATWEKHRKWVEQQRASLLARLPDDHLARIANRIEAARPGSANAPEILRSVIFQIGRQSGRPVAELDDERFALLLSAYRRLADEAPPETLANEATDLDALWAALEVPHGRHADRLAELASVRAHIAFSSGHRDEASNWMDRYVDKSPPDAKFAPVLRAWFLLDAGRAEEALKEANAALQTKDSRLFPRSQWQAVAGWAELNQGHPREADVYFQAALNEKAARMEEAIAKQSWWLRLLARGVRTALNADKRVDGATLDHLVALEGYDPQKAAQMEAELRSLSSAQGRANMAFFVEDAFDGWGKARQAAHRKKLANLGIPQGARNGTDSDAVSAPEMPSQDAPDSGRSERQPAANP